jgi:DNA-nicking Smr family endonuclease
MADVAPLQHNPTRPSRGPARTQTLTPGPLETENLEVLAHLEDLVGGRLQFDLVDSDEYIEGYIKGIHPLILERLRQGLFSVQGHLDLHGLTVREAETAVREFIETAVVRNERCVLLVHGRGINSKDHIPVLKRRLETILLRSSIRKKILAFTSARPHDGGAGASYLLLRTWR